MYLGFGELSNFSLPICLRMFAESEFRGSLAINWFPYIATIGA